MGERPPQRSATGASEVVRFLVEQGHRHVFGLPGSQLVPVFHALQNTGIALVPTIHESVTIAAADGYARVRGSAVAMLYMLPGAANGAANLYNAYRDETPLVVLASQQVSTARTEHGAFCEGDTVPLLAPFTRLAHELTAGTPVRSWLDKAARAALGPPSGPAFLSITEDVFLDEAPVLDERQSARGRPAVPDVSAVAEALRDARRPLIVVGGQLRRQGGSERVEQLAAAWQIPVAFEAGPNDRLGIAPGHSHCVGSLFTHPQYEAEADAVLLLGTRFVSEASPRKKPYFGKARFVAQVNLDPKKLEGTRRVDWVSVSDPAAFADALHRELAAALPDPEVIEARRAWLSDRPAFPAPRGALGVLVEGMKYTVGWLHDAMDRGWLVDETVMAGTLLLGALSARDGSRYASTSGASLGWGTGAAAGIAIGSGEPVTLAIGDGSLRFGLHGLWTIRAMNLPVTIVVLDNGGYASTRNYERMHVQSLGAEAVPQRPGYLNMDMRETGPSLEQLIEGFGIPCRRVGPEEDGRAAIEVAWATSGEGPNAVILTIPFED